MAFRLVLGSGTLAQSVVGTLAERGDDLAVVASDENAVTTLREEGVAARTGDVTDVEALTAVDARPETVVVATDDAATNAAAAGAATSAYPDVFVLAYAGFDAPVGVRDELEAAADEVVDGGRATTEYLIGRIGERGVRTRKLMAVLRGLSGRLAVVTHANPDPDAIASAMALRRIATAAGCAVDVCYHGEITHQENRAFVNLLEYDLRALDPDDDLAAYDGVALVDHSQPGVNDSLPGDIPIDIVVDHHPPRMPVEARFVDLRSDVGATSSLLVDYLRKLGIAPDRSVATGLLYGIRVDTDEFTREVSSADFEAAAFLLPHADVSTLERIEAPSMSPDTLDTIARAIVDREQHGPVLLSGVGQLTDRDALAQAADRLLNLEGVSTTLVYGIADGTAYVSARARGTDVDLGETLRDAFGQIGSAGGHADMAGAQISLGLLEAIDEDDTSLSSVVHSIVSDRFMEALESRTNRVLRDVYPEGFHGVEGTDAADLALADLAEAGDGASAGDDADSTADDDPSNGNDDGDPTDRTDDGDPTDRTDGDPTDRTDDGPADDEQTERDDAGGGADGSSDRDGDSEGRAVDGEAPADRDP